MLMMNLYSTCSTSYLSVRIYKIHLFTTATADLEVKIGFGVLSLLLLLERCYHSAQTNSRYCYSKPSCPTILTCTEKSLCSLPVSMIVQCGQNKRQMGVGRECLTKRRNTLQTRAISAISILSLHTYSLQISKSFYHKHNIT
jgi:hypothetical protein